MKILRSRPECGEGEIKYKKASQAAAGPAQFTVKFPLSSGTWVFAPKNWCEAIAPV